METHRHLLSLIEEVYAAPGTTNGWVTFLEHACQTLHGSGANLVAHNLVAPEASILLTVGLDPEAGEAYARQWGRLDPWAYSAGTRALVSGQVVTGEQLVPQAHLKRTGFYQEFGRRYDVTRCLAGMVEHDGRGLSCLTIDRGDGGRPFEAADADVVAALVPHLRTALGLHRRLMTTESDARVRGEALDRVSHAVFLLAASGRIVFANRRGAALLDAGDGVACRHGVLEACHRRASADLQAAIARAAVPLSQPDRQAGGLVLLPRPDPQRALAARVAPMSRAADQFVAPAACVIVVVTDPEQPIGLDDGALAQLFGLTPAESRLARLIAEGRDLADAAAQLGLSIGTVRTRIKTVLHKTGTRRQSALVRVLRAVSDAG